jgi:acyl-CoA synthetase (NDP forming)
MNLLTFSELRKSKTVTSETNDESSSMRVKLLKDELAEIIHQAVRDNRSYLMEHESKEILEGIGIATTGYLVARSEDEALAMSEKIGFPVVLKIVSPDVVHKTDAGGVKLNLGTAKKEEKCRIR